MENSDSYGRTRCKSLSVNITLELRDGKLEWRAIVVVADRFCFPNGGKITPVSNKTHK